MKTLILDLEEIFHLYQRSAKSEHILSALRNSISVIHLKGLHGSSASFVSSAICKESKYPNLFIFSDKEEAIYFLNDLENLLGEERVLFFSSSFKKTFPSLQTDSIQVQMRAEVLNRIRKNPEGILVVTYAEALSEKVVTKKNLESSIIDLKVGESAGQEAVISFLSDSKFERVDFVTAPGQYAVRGGIVDVFSYADEMPYRIVFAGDVLESVRMFESLTQLSVKKLNSITILPDVQSGLANESLESLLNFIPQDTKIWIKNTSDVLELIHSLYDKAQQFFEKATGEEVPNKDSALLKFNTRENCAEQLERFTLLEFGTHFYFKSGESTDFNVSRQPSFNKNFELLSQNLFENRNKNYANFIFADTAKQVERIYAIFEDLSAQKKIPQLPKEKFLFTSQQLALHEGFIDHDLRIACYTDHQIFDRYHRFRLRQSFTSAAAITLKELSELKPGDYVTHIDHGIGKYGGLEKIEVNGKTQEAIRLIYRDNDILYISIHSLHRIARYSGKDGEVPSVSKLGSNAWSNLKQKTKKKVKDIARDLILLYAKRKAQEGFAFSKDTYLQTELEASFIYEDTPDQFKATVDVKKDMESGSPMDRLICGDVGFGKTEIAVRAAFKAAADGKQVAILVPTTILALQHFKTFSERLKNFPVSVDYINRFKSSKQQKETIRKLEEGKIDIIIGTHRLLSKEIKFKDLGLLIIDEEQKFGVSSKEKLKSLKVNVDTLTLTATPIPRTLQFSMMGARDLSLINTAPPNRYPVTTELHVFNEEIIRETISHEIQRGGQVFFVHNRVQNIHEMADMIQRLLPRAKIAVGHGQMDGSQLEEIMLRFIEGDCDVLISTTIIESGLDIPNANTIIIHGAHMFGLSDLHQMRGRVGRSNKKAFCYLLAPPASVLTPQAKQRLKAIEEFSDLGSGIHIAMRDLDIRGAGNLLGGEQSGFITELGFEMYHKILDEAIRELKETDFKDLFQDSIATEFVSDCSVESDLEILIPDYYVENITERLNLYKELDDIGEEEKISSFLKNIEDRFGPVPSQVHDLVNTVRLRWIAGELGFEKIYLKNNRFSCYFVSNPDSPFYKSELFMNLIKVIQQNRSAKMREEKQKLSISFSGVNSVNAAFKILSDIKAKAILKVSV